MDLKKCNCLSIDAKGNAVPLAETRGTHEGGSSLYCELFQSGISKIDWVIPYNDKTIVIWRKGVNTMISVMDGDEHDVYADFCAAMSRKIFGSAAKVKEILDGKLTTGEKSEGKTISDCSIICDIFLDKQTEQGG